MTPSSTWFCWTPAAEQRLRDLAATGLSASQIATQMGAATRNTIIGKAHRMGVKIGNPPPRSSQKVAYPAERREPSKVAARQPEARKMRVAPIPVAVPPVVFNPPTTDGVRLVDIREHQCRWPLGDPRSADFRFCGADAERSFCTFHHRLAYVPLRPAVKRVLEAA